MIGGKGIILTNIPVLGTLNISLCIIRVDIERDIAEYVFVTFNHNRYLLCIFSLIPPFYFYSKLRPLERKGERGAHVEAYSIGGSFVLCVDDIIYLGSYCIINMVYMLLLLINCRNQLVTVFLLFGIFWMLKITLHKVYVCCCKVFNMS